MCIGAYVGATFSLMTEEILTSAAVRFPLALLLSGIVAAIFGFLIGIPVLRLRGDYLAIVTLAFGEILRSLTENLHVGLDSAGLHLSMSNGGVQLQEGGKMIISGALGATGIKPISTFVAGILLVLFTVAVVLNLVHSREGRAIKAVRDNRIAAESVGINATTFKLKAFVISAVLAGMAGALFGLNLGSVQASKFSYTTSIDILVYVVLGGMGNMLGSIISTVVLYLIPEFLRSLADYRMIMYAVVLIVVMLCTWSPKVKEKVAIVSDKFSRMFKKKEVETNG